ncbi:MAG: HIT domain-containing protein [Kiritimatiellae bacterium]|jgi:ATP adenylyltransferase|nr:HIT domain-containing protein [Kiritimatiellia bacterium]NLD89866.1 HIT domain-containing protein [Lentisphaerota bacterium]HPC19658.1 HIT domain-containing protein [Kiritimatiellia bacterium]
MTDFQTAQQLWAPWRMEFIRAPKEPGCFLCRIIREGSEKDDENLVVYRGAHGLLLMNRFPYTTGHLLAAPLRHEGALTALSAEERQEMLDLACLGQRLLDTVAKPGGYNLGINQGVPAGAGLEDHLHLHVVPRWEGDSNFMPVTGRIRVMPQALWEMHRALRAELARTEHHPRTPP